MEFVVIGVDLGQKQDYTAVVVNECTEGEDKRLRHTIRDLGRLALGTSYVDIAARLVDIVSILESQEPQEFLNAPPVIWRWPAVAVDATGVGAPVVDILKRALRGHRCKLQAVTFSHGDKLNRSGGEWRLGKAYLVSQLQALLQTRRLLLPVSKPETAALVKELMDYEIRVDQDANDKYGAFKVGSHDDLVTALGLAVVYGEQEGRATFTAGPNPFY